MDTKLKFSVGDRVVITDEYPAHEYRGLLGRVSKVVPGIFFPFEVTLDDREWIVCSTKELNLVETLPVNAWCGICGKDVPDATGCNIILCPRGGSALQASQSVEDAFAPPPATDVAPEPETASPGPSEPIRVQFLNKAISLTAGDRDKEYGDPLVNMACAGDLKNVFRSYLAISKRPIHPSELEALDMVATKLSRLLCGKPKPDTYVDGAAYFGIAGECASRSGYMEV